MQLSIIILNYKVPYHLLQCIESAEKSIKNLNAEIIVVDNNSQDESGELVKKYFPTVKFIANPNNDGFSKGNNIGIAKAKGELICLLNPDTVVGENIFKNLLDFTKKHSDFGAIGVRLIDGSGSFLPESKRNIPTPKIALQKLLNNNTNYYSALEEHQTGKVEILPGAFMLMKKDRYKEVGGLDEDYFMYGEDIDLSYKFLKANYQNYYVGSEVVLHYKGESTAKNAVYRKRFYDAMMIFYQKHFEKNNLSRQFVNLGLKLARITHAIRKKENTTPPIIQNIICVNHSEELILKLQKLYKKEIKPSSLENLEKDNITSSLLIFNAEKLSFDTILQQIQKLNSENNLFRIKPKTINVLIGSDNSTIQGEVVFL